MEELTVVPTTEDKLMFHKVESFGPGQLSFFCQEFGVDPKTELQRHRHPVMDEIFWCTEGQMEVATQETIDDDASIHVLNPGEYTHALHNVLHTLRNRGNKPARGIAFGVILAANGTTIRE